MIVKLLSSSGLIVADIAIGKCWGKQSPVGEINRDRIHKVGNKNKHASTLEHLTYSFDIDGISRACLQELARHRIASLSVKSTRYTLKELKDSIEQKNMDPMKWASNFCVMTGNKDVDLATYLALVNLQDILQLGISNDIAKFCLPESYKTSLVWTINARSLQNFLGLRTSKSAMWEIKNLANYIYDQIPEDHKYLFEEFVNVEEETCLK